MASALLIFKPDAAHRIAVRRALWNALSDTADIKVRGLRWFQPPRELIEEHYGFLRERPFFAWLVDFMTAVPVLVGGLEGESQALEQLRYELGETRIQESRPGSLRERFGIYGGINCLHVSDSVENGEKETELWARHVNLEGIEFSPEGGDAPDHTYHLRSLAAQVAAGRHAELGSLEMKRLLKEETELEGDQLEAFFRIVLGALV